MVGSEMCRMLLRIWLVAVILLWGYHLYLYRDKLHTFKDRDWRLALEYGINNFLCDFKVFGNCRDVPVPFWKRTEINETFGIIVNFFGWPLLLLVVCLIVAWILRSPRRA